MVTVFNPQALSDPGPTAASGLISSGMGTASNMLMNRSQNRMNLINQLLQTGGLAAREYLTRKNEQEQGQDTLQALIDTGMIPAGTKDKPYQIPEGANIDAKAIATIAGQYGPLAQLRAANYYANIGKTGSEAGSQYGNEILEYGLRKAQDVGGIKPSTMGTAEPTPSYDPTTGKYIAGAGEQTAMPNLITQGKQADIEAKRQAIREKELTLKLPEKINTEMSVNEQNKLTQGQGALRTYDTKQTPFTAGGKMVPYSEVAQGDIDAFLQAKQFNPKLEAEANTTYQGKRRALNDLITSYEEIRPLVASNFFESIRNKIATDPNFLLVSNDPKAAKLRAFINQLQGAETLKVAVQTQGSRPTDKDVEIILTSMPDLLANKTLFDARLKTFLGKTIQSTLDEGVVLNRVADVRELGSKLKSTFGKDYEYGKGFDDLPEAPLEAFKPLPQRQSQAPRPSAAAMNRVKQAKGQSAPAAGGSSQLSKAKLLLQQMEEQDNAAAGKIIRAR
jgi:hypothetical protein